MEGCTKATLSKGSVPGKGPDDARLTGGCTPAGLRVPGCSGWNDPGEEPVGGGVIEQGLGGAQGRLMAPALGTLASTLRDCSVREVPVSRSAYLGF